MAPRTSSNTCRVPGSSTLTRGALIPASWPQTCEQQPRDRDRDADSRSRGRTYVTGRVLATPGLAASPVASTYSSNAITPGAAEKQFATFKLKGCVTSSRSITSRHRQYLGHSVSHQGSNAFHRGPELCSESRAFRAGARRQFENSLGPLQKPAKGYHTCDVALRE